MIDTKIIIIALALLLLAILVKQYRSRAARPLILAFIMAGLWSTYFRYEYVGSNLFLFNRINIYPLVLWTAGLTTLQIASYKLPNQQRLIGATILYFIFLMAAEVVGYYLLNIRLQSQYTSLLNLGIIHAPTATKIFYVLAGPVYLALFSWLYQSSARQKQ